MENAIRKQNIHVKRGEAQEIALVDQMDGKSSEDRSWFREFLCSIFSSPDLDYSQFIQLESKKTRHQIEANRWY